MKRCAALLLLVFVFLVGATSCVREYKCQCWIKYSGQPGLPDSTLKEYDIRDTKDKAQDLCQGNSSQSKDNATGITTDERCDLY